MTPRRLSLLEVVVSAGLVLLIVIVLGSTALTGKRVTAASNQGLELDRQARRVLDELRTDLRRSGWARTGTPMLSVPPDGPVVSVRETPAPPAAANGVDLLVYRVRLGPTPADWGPAVTIRAVPAASNPLQGLSPALHSYRLERVQAGAPTVVLLHGVSRARVERLADSDGVRLRLELSARAIASGGDPPRAATRIYRDQVQMLNPRPE